MATVAELKERYEKDKLARIAKGLPPKVYPKGTKRSTKTAKVYTDCKHRGKEVVDTVNCPTCKGTVALKVFPCEVFEGGCTISKRVSGRACCDQQCPSYESSTTE